MSDLVERLRREGADAFHKHYSLGMWKLCAEAADEIERLRSSDLFTPRDEGAGALSRDNLTMKGE